MRIKKIQLIIVLSLIQNICLSNSEINFQEIDKEVVNSNKSYVNDSIDFFQIIVNKQPLITRDCKTFAEIEYLNFHVVANIKKIPSIISKCINLKNIVFIDNKNITNWDEVFKLLKGFKKLNSCIFKNTNLEEIPLSFTKLKLETVTFSRQSLTRTSYKRLNNFTGELYLELDSLNLDVIPKEIRKIYSLESLNLSNNPNLDVENVIELISDLPNLYTLNLSKCEINKIPHNYSRLPKSLKVINLKDNPLWQNSLNDLCQFAKRQNVDVYESLKSMPYLPECLKNHISTFDPVSNSNIHGHYKNITFVPSDSVDYYMANQSSFLKKYAPWSSSYHHFQVFRNQWSFDGERFLGPQLQLKSDDVILFKDKLIEHYKEYLETIEIIDISNNGNEVIEVLSNFPKLHSLFFKGSLDTLPANLNLLKNIDRLLFNECELGDISSSINRISNLKEIRFFSCTNLDIEKIGEVLSFNTSIKKLAFIKSQITYLPNTFCNMSKLKTITLNEYEEDRVNHWTPNQIKALSKMPPDESLLLKIEPCENGKTFNVIGEF